MSTTGQIVARFPDGASAAVTSTYGKGKTLMLGSYLSAAYVTSPTAEVERFYAGLLAWAGVVIPVTAQGGKVEARTLEAGNDTLLFVFNHDVQPVDASLGMRVEAGAYRGLDLVSGQPVSVARDREFVRLHKRLDGSGVWVVRLTRQ